MNTLTEQRAIEIASEVQQRCSKASKGEQAYGAALVVSALETEFARDTKTSASNGSSSAEIKPLVFSDLVFLLQYINLENANFEYIKAESKRLLKRIENGAASSDTNASNSVVSSRMRNVIDSSESSESSSETFREPSLPVSPFNMEENQSKAIDLNEIRSRLNAVVSVLLVASSCLTDIEWELGQNECYKR